MRSQLLHRLVNMPPRELAARGRTGMRRKARWLAWSLRSPAWRREDLAGELKGSHPVMQRAAERLTAHDWRGAHETLAAYYAARPVRFPLAPSARGPLSRLIRDRFPGACLDAAGRADRALEARLDVLGYEHVDFSAPDGSGSIDWHRDPIHQRAAPRSHWSRVPYLSPSIGDHKIIWELNRHQHWLALGRAYWLTGDERYRGGFVRQLGDWLRDNPPETGINWASMLELSLRSLSWIWALHFFVAPPPGRRSTPAAEAPWIVDLLLGLHRQLSLVEHNLSTYFSPNTHLIGEALALYVTGRALPELARAERWAERGRQILLEEIDRQIYPDGGHVELSTHYHRYTLDFYLLALAVARTTGDRDADARFAQAAVRLARFARTMADTENRLPGFGDDDGGMLFPISGANPVDVGPSLDVAAILLDAPALASGRVHEETAWLCGTVPAVPEGARPGPSAALLDSGYVVSRTSRGDHLVMDVGRLGYLNGGHAHADALSLVLTVARLPLLIDPGTACYTVDRATRDRFRSSAFHNTAILDGRSQSAAGTPFAWRSRARAWLEAWRTDERFDYVEGSHDGYGPGGHQRQVLARPGCWIVVDWIHAPHRQCAVHWHLHPAWSVDIRRGDRIGLRHESGRRIWILALNGTIDVCAGGGRAYPLGWCSPVYGRVVPTTSLRIAAAGRPPYPVITLVTDRRGQPRAERLDVTGADGAPVDGAAFRWQAHGFTETVIAGPPGSGPTVRRAGHFDSDARWLTVRERASGAIEGWWVDDPAGHADPAHPDEMVRQHHPDVTRAVEA